MAKKRFLETISSVMLVFGLVFMGCGNIVNDNPNNDIEDVAVAVVKITLPNQEERSAADLISQTTAYQLIVTKAEEEVFNDIFSATESTIRIELIPGSHTFTLNALKESEILGTGSKSVTLSKGENNVEIVLIPINQGIDEGTYATINVSWSPGGLQDFFGTWINSNYVTRIISSTEIMAVSSSFSYTFRVDSVTPVVNSNAETRNEYPEGFIFSGTITEMNRGSLSSDVSQGGVPDVGNAYSTTYYMHVNKGSFSSGGTGTAIFTKQP
jgi:hypothetical protein